MQPNSSLARPTRVASSAFEGMVQRHEAEGKEMQEWLDVPVGSSLYKGKGGAAASHDPDDDEYYGAQDSDEYVDDSDEDSDVGAI